MAFDPTILAAIAAVVVIVIAAVAALAVVARAAFTSSRIGAPKSLGLLLQRGNFLRVATAVAVVVAAVFLALVGKLTDGAAAILSGVAGYVLGGLERSRGGSNPDPEEDA